MMYGLRRRNENPAGDKNDSMKPKDFTIHSFEQRGPVDIVCVFGLDNGQVIADVYARYGKHEREKRIHFGSQKRAGTAARMASEINRAKGEVELAVKNRAATLQTLIELSGG